MVTSTKGKVIILAAIAAFAIMVFAAPRAYAQTDGPCCAQTQVVQASCKSTSCSGNFRYVACLTPFGPGSTHYRVDTVGCCLDKATSYVAPSGGDKGCSDDAVVVVSRPSTALDTALYAGGVWVRTCAGKYVFTTRPS
jgi:hypothetical protein